MEKKQMEDKTKMERCIHVREPGLKEDNATNRTEWRKKINNSTGDTR